MGVSPLETPTLSKVKAMAKRQGIDVVSNKLSPLFFLVATGTNDLRCPKRGVTLEEAWLLISLPEDDPRALKVWTEKPEPATLPKDWFDTQ